jgi:adenylate kinase
MPTYIVLLGPPGAGKGTQAQKISAATGLPHVSSGDIFRENIRSHTELGLKADEYIKRGELVPDDITIAMIRERLSRQDCAAGALLDGFPRTPAQADALEDILVDFHGKVNAVPYIDVPDTLLIERLSGRWTCRLNVHVFHEKYNPPKEPGVCDYDGSELYQRDDDTVETVTRRIRVYLGQTQPLIDYYRQRELLIEIDGTQDIEQVSTAILAALASGKLL